MHFRPHTKTTENGNENGGFRKRFQKRTLLKTHRFENAPFLVWIVENECFCKRCRKKSHSSISVLRRSVVDDRRNVSKSMLFPMVSNENELVWRGENKTKTLVWSKYFALFSLRRKRILLITH